MVKNINSTRMIISFSIQGKNKNYQVPAITFYTFALR